jgi:transposase
MIIAPGFVGIDISKHHLDIFDGAAGSPERHANTPEAVAPLAQRFAEAGAFVLFEATGTYDRHLRRALAHSGVAHARVNPERARAFARAAGFLAKTDAIDARMLAAMAQCLRPAPHSPTPPARERLTALVRRRDQLVATRAQERTRRREGHDPEIVQDLARHIAWLDEAIGACDQRIAALVAAEPSLRQTARLLRSVPGIGPVAAAAVMALLPELGSRSPKTIAALVGLAPMNCDSGQQRGQRHVRGGRKRVRDALYMAALAAARSASPLAAFHTALKQAGKPPKLALIALARKILTILNAIIREQKPFKITAV